MLSFHLAREQGMSGTPSNLPGVMGSPTAALSQLPWELWAAFLWSWQAAVGQMWLWSHSQGHTHWHGCPPSMTHISGPSAPRGVQGLGEQLHHLFPKIKPWPARRLGWAAVAVTMLGCSGAEGRSHRGDELINTRQFWMMSQASFLFSF